MHTLPIDRITYALLVDTVDLHSPKNITVEEALTASPQQLNTVVLQAVDNNTPTQNILAFLEDLSGQDETLAQACLEEYEKYVSCKPQARLKIDQDLRRNLQRLFRKNG